MPEYGILYFIFVHNQEVSLTCWECLNFPVKRTMHDITLNIKHLYLIYEDLSVYDMYSLKLPRIQHIHCFRFPDLSFSNLVFFW